MKYTAEMIMCMNGSEKMDTAYLRTLEKKDSFSRAELLAAIKEYGIQVSDSMFKVVLKKLTDAEKIIRVGRNAYCVNKENRRIYEHIYSDLARNIAREIAADFPYLSFSIFELVQLNAFVNHQIAHNVVFVSVESDLGEFVFDKLKEKHPGKVLIYPSIEIYHQYWCDDMIVIQKLISESPTGNGEKWHTRIEKMLVDIFADDVQKESFSESELAGIYEDAFLRYAIDESCLFRYAKRRGIQQRLKEYLTTNTNVKLRKE
jgi:hypothetical protein